MDTKHLTPAFVTSERALCRRLVLTYFVTVEPDKELRRRLTASGSTASPVA